MEEQSDTPRTDALMNSLRRIVANDHERVSTTIGGLKQLGQELATATRERDEARALNAQWAEKAAAWFASPEAAQRLQGYRDLAQQVATAQNERDEARAEVERLRKTLDEIAAYWNGSHRPAETLDAAEWMRGVAEEALAATEAP